MDLEVEDMKYKVGDKVRGTDMHEFYHRRGSIGVVRMIDDCGRAWVDYGDGQSNVTFDHEIEPENTLTPGNTYKDRKGNNWECIFVRDGKAWMMHDNGTAYVWDADTGETIGLAIDPEYNIAFPEKRHGTVEYIDGVPQFDTWKEDV